MMFGHRGMGMMIVMSFVWLIVLFGIVGGIVYLVKASSRRGTYPTQDAAAILDERYARGEIDHDEYERRRHALGLPTR
jgi:putative membrane protein